MLIARALTQLHAQFVVVLSHSGIGLEDREVVSLKPGGERRTSKILHLAKDSGVYVLQGAESGKGWTAIVNQSDGRLTITASSSGDAFVVFGVCTSSL